MTHPNTVAVHHEGDEGDGEGAVTVTIGETGATLDQVYDAVRQAVHGLGFTPDAVENAFPVAIR